MSLTKDTYITITDLHWLEIARVMDTEEARAVKGWGYKTNRYVIRKITTSSMRRLVEVVARQQWSVTRDETWYESGLGYDYLEHVSFEWPRREQNEPVNLANYLRWLRDDVFGAPETTESVN